MDRLVARFIIFSLIVGLLADPVNAVAAMGSPSQRSMQAINSCFHQEALLLRLLSSRRFLMTNSGDHQVSSLSLFKNFNNPSLHPLSRRRFLKNFFILGTTAVSRVSFAGPSNRSALSRDLLPYADWVRRQELPNKPLVASFQIPDGIGKLVPFANTYDQALAAILAIRSNDRKRAEEILDYFLALRSLPPKSDRADEAGRLSTGEIVWIGIAAAQYTSAYGATRYEPLMQRIDAFLISMQRDGGRILGERGQPWASTEHNVDVLAYTTMRIKLTKDDRLVELRKGVAEWWLTSAYIRNTDRIRRGHGDDTFATDAYTWSILVLGAIEQMDHKFFQESGLATVARSGLLRTLKSTKDVLTTVVYDKPTDGKVTLEAFRFTNDPKSTPSGEWTAGAALAAKYVYDKVDASQWLAGLKRAGVSDFKGGRSIAYAFAEGLSFPKEGTWVTPTYLSVASASWYVFAEDGYNPFILGGGTVPVKKFDSEPIFRRLGLPFAIVTGISWILFKSFRWITRTRSPAYPHDVRSRMGMAA